MIALDPPPLSQRGKLMGFDNLFLNFNKGGGVPHIPIPFPQTYDLKKMQSIPEHPKNRSGVCFVVGTHPCADDDIAAARSAIEAMSPEKLPISVCAINDAAGLIYADHIATAHPEKLEQFLEGVEHPIEIHSRSKMKRPGARADEYVWNLNTGAGSALFGAAVMLAIGYELVVLCGCPMNGGGGYSVKKHDGSLDDPRFGELSPAHSLVQGWQEQLRRFKEENALAGRVRSMSGYTRKIFGGL